jgi:hypothetical protein
VRPEGLGKLKNSLHRESNPRPTTTLPRAPTVRVMKYILIIMKYDDGDVDKRLILNSFNVCFPTELYSLKSWDEV